MARFTTRVELHSAKTWYDYDTLHTAMEREGFTRTLKTDDGEVQLPTAEYNREASITRDEVLESAKRAATATGHKFSILVTESNGRVFIGLPKV